MLKWVAAIAAALVGCAASKPPVESPRHPPPATIRIGGSGTELHTVNSVATLGDVHAALSAAGALRLTSEADASLGMERFQVDVDMIDPIVRAVSPDASPVPLWLGVPVRWRPLGDVVEGGGVEVRAWQVPTELGPRGVVELRSDAGEGYELECLLTPGTAMLLTTGTGAWPVSRDAGHPVPSVMARLMRWDELTDRGARLYVIIPRFGPDASSFPTER